MSFQILQKSFLFFLIFSFLPFKLCEANLKPSLLFLNDLTSQVKINDNAQIFWKFYKNSTIIVKFIRKLDTQDKYLR